MNGCVNKSNSADVTTVSSGGQGVCSTDKINGEIVKNDDASARKHSERALSTGSNVLYTKFMFDFALKYIV